MRISLYIGVWVVLVVATLLELVLVGMPLTLSMMIFGILGLAVLKALLIALFYQHLIGEALWVKLLYTLSLVTAVGLIVGMVTSLYLL